MKQFKRALINNTEPYEKLNENYKINALALKKKITEIETPDQIIPIYSELFELLAQYKLLAAYDMLHVFSVPHTTLSICEIIEITHKALCNSLPDNIKEGCERSLATLEKKIEKTISNTRRNFPLNGKVYNLNKHAYLLTSCKEQGLVDKNAPITEQIDQYEPIQNILLNAIYDTIQSHTIERI